MMSPREAPAFTYEAEAIILASVEAGMARARAATLAGVAPGTLATWERLGNQGDPRFTEFATRVSEAEARAESKLLKVIADAAIGDGDWKAAAWVLERRFRDAWGPPVKEPVDDVTKMSDDEVERRLKELENA